MRDDVLRRHPVPERPFPRSRLELRRRHLVEEVASSAPAGLRRPLRSVPRRPLAIALCVLGAALAAAPGLGIPERARDLFSIAAGERVTGSWVLPGRPVRPDALLEGTLRDQPDIRPATVREVASAGAGRSRLSLVAALDARGRVCAAAKNEGVMGDFECLDGAFASRHAIFRFSSSGGATTTSVDWGTVVGFVRSDVVRLVGVSRSGAEAPIRIDERLGFGYSGPAREFPVALRAYDARGELVDETELPALAPPCGASAPCD